jgi:hypothetical protein
MSLVTHPSVLDAVLVTVIICSSITLLLIKWLASSANKAIESIAEISRAKGFKNGAYEMMIWHRDQEIMLPPEERLEVQKSTARYYASILNDALAIDSAAVTQLFATELKTNAAMLEHQTWPVSECDGFTTISPIGLVNALLPPTRNRFRVAAVWNDKTGLLESFVAWDVEKSEALQSGKGPVVKISLGPGEARDAGTH